MGENKFFKPTVLYKEYMILDLIEKDANITQRQMSQAIGIAVSMVNDYLSDYEKKGLIKKKKHSTKTVEYFVTKKGLERRKYLNIGYLNSSQLLYNRAKENIEKFLTQIKENGFNNIILYGAGEVAEILLNTINSNKSININALAIVDDDILKVGGMLLTTNIIAQKDIMNYEHDGILISSFANNEMIFNKLKQINYPTNKILQFFSLR